MVAVLHSFGEASFLSEDRLFNNILLTLSYGGQELHTGKMVIDRELAQSVALPGFRKYLSASCIKYFEMSLTQALN